MPTISEKRDIKIGKIKSSLKKIPIISKNVAMVRQKIKAKELNVSTKRSELSYDKTTTENHQILPSKFSINHFQQKYIVGKKIGQGANGLVRQCYHLKRQKTYAVKTMMIDQEHIPNLKKNFFHIQKLRHPNIVKYKSLYIDVTKHLSYLVMQYIQLPSLSKYFEKQTKPIRQDSLKWIFHQILKTLSYLHSNNICHRDIKPDNILVDSFNKKIKLIDFGISKNMTIRKQKVNMFTITGTLFYRAPQMFKGMGYNQKVDLWAVGISLYELITGMTPFQSQYHSDTVDKICNIQEDLQNIELKKCSKLLRNLIHYLLKKEPKQRLSAREAVENLWFDGQRQRKTLEITKKRTRSCDRMENIVTEFSKFHPKLKQVNQGLLYMKEQIDQINGNDFHLIQTNYF